MPLCNAFPLSMDQTYWLLTHRIWWDVISKLRYKKTNFHLQFISVLSTCPNSTCVLPQSYLRLLFPDWCFDCSFVRDPEPEPPNYIASRFLTYRKCEEIHICCLRPLGLGIICYEWQISKIHVFFPSFEIIIICWQVHLFYSRWLFLLDTHLR